jgi:cytochrome P450
LDKQAPKATIDEVRTESRTRRAVQRPPGPKGVGARLKVFGARRDPLGFLVGLWRQYGDVAFFKAGPFDVYLLSHPDAIRDVLVTHNARFMKGQGLQEMKRLLGEGLLTSEGELHKRQRRLIQPMFHHTRIEGYGEVMVERTIRMRDSWQDGQDLDVHEQMMRLTLSIVAKTLFDTDIEDREAQRVADALSTSLGLFDKLTSPLSNLLMRLPSSPGLRQFEGAKGVLDEIVYGMIEERRRTGDRGDLLSTLLLAQESDGERMTNVQVRDEAITIFLAGHETTSNALTWTWYLLSQHPDVEANLHEELDTALGDRPPTVADLPNLPYTERVLTESMRLYPPAWILGRRALVEHEVDGYRIPAGSIVVTAQYIVHHDPRWFPDPYRFDPDRWLRDRVSSRPKYSYFPFGGGQRLCIGEPFAWMEGELLLATLAQRWKLRLVRGQPIDLSPVVTLRPKHGMKMTVLER